MRQLAIIENETVLRLLTEQETMEVRHGLVQQQFKLFDELRESTSTSETFMKRLSSVRHYLDTIGSIQSLLVELAE